MLSALCFLELRDAQIRQKRADTHHLHWAHLVVREALALLLSHEAAEEGHGDEAEGDDEEHRATDDTLGLRPDGDTGNMT